MEENILQEKIIDMEAPLQEPPEEIPDFDIKAINELDYEFIKVDLLKSNTSLEYIKEKVPGKFVVDNNLFMAMSKEVIKDNLDHITKAFFMNSSKISYDNFISNYDIKYNKDKDLIKEEDSEEATVSAE